ncbi:MAG: alpha/beta hydrolase family esterase [Bacteroidales bacterium]
MARMTRVMLAVALALLAVWPARAADEGLREIWHQDSKAGPAPAWTIRVHAYAPPSLKAPSAPAVVLLHGCLQGPREFFEDGGWRQVADERGMLVVSVEFDDVGEHCLWWFQPDQRRPATASQAAAIVKGLAEARRQYNVPQGDNYVAGLSAGGAMTVVMLALYPDLFAAGGAVAGVPFDCPAMTMERRLTWKGQPCLIPGMDQLPQACACMAGDVDNRPAEWARAVAALHPGRTHWPRIAVWHGTTDPVVVCRNGLQIASQWSLLHGGGVPDLSCPGRQGRIIAKRNPAGDKRWTLPGKDGRPLVELRLLDGFTHAMPIDEKQGCGHSGKGFAEAGVCAARGLADFFLGGQ